LRPAALAILPVECSPRGSSRSTRLSRSSCCLGRCTCGRVWGSGSGAGAGAGSGLSATGGASPYRAWHAAHITIGSPSPGRSTLNRRQWRPDRQTAQCRPARSISARSSALTAINTSR
jgi:hypothetical protein